MASHIAALSRAQVQAPRAQSQLTGAFVARISSVRSGLVRVVIPELSGEQEIGPCVLPIGLLGVGPATVDTTGTGSVTKAVVMSNATALIKGLQVLVMLPANGKQPWIVAIAPTGPGV